MNDDEFDQLALMIIHQEVDPELCNALARWFESQAVSKGQVFTNLAYMLATEICVHTPGEASACVVATKYERYIHALVHSYFDPVNSRKKSH